MAKESTLVQVVKEIGERLNKTKQEKAGLEANKNLLQTRMKDTADELMKILNADNLNSAFSKLMALTNLEVEFENTMNKIQQCYDTGEFENFKEYTDKANSLVEKMKKIMELRIEKKDTDEKVVEDKEEKVEPEKEVDKYDEFEVDEPKVEQQVKKHPKIQYEEDDDDEDI